MIEVKFGENKGNRSNLDFTLIKVNYNKCDTKTGGTFIHRMLNEIINKNNKKPECPIKKGKLFESGYVEDAIFPPVPKIMFPSGSVRFLATVFVTGRPATLKSMTNIASYEIGGTFKK